MASSTKMTMASDTRESSASTVTKLNTGLYDYLYKIVLVGDTNVGKSSLVNRYAKDTFNEEGVATMSTEFNYRDLRDINGTVIRVQIWDTMGQEKF